ncbi:Nuclear pore complex protein Nup54 [Sesbania bispinosa]|nr:Nuclear pore complex protein Nup54 [Sesbania bispinosa]
MRIVEALEGKGCRIPLTKGEAELAEKLATVIRQLKGSGAELSRRVQNLLTVSRVQAKSNGFGGSIYLPGSTKIHEQSLADLQEVLQQQMEAIARLGSVLKRDIRDMEIMMAEDTMGV